MQKILCLPFFVRAAYMLQSISVEQSPNEHISDYASARNICEAATWPKENGNGCTRNTAQVRT